MWAVEIVICLKVPSSAFSPSLPNLRQFFNHDYLFDNTKSLPT